MRLDIEEVVVQCSDCGARLFNLHQSEARQNPRIQYAGGNYASQPCPYAKKGSDGPRKMGCKE